MIKSKSIVLDSQDMATESDLCSAVEREQAVISSGPSENAIRSAAYALYTTRNGMDGSAEDDWLRAEAQLMQIGSSGV